MIRPVPSHDRLRRAAGTALRVAMSGGLLLVLLRRTEIHDVIGLLGGILERPALLAVALLLPSVGSFVGVLRWRALLRGLRVTLKRRTLMVAILVGSFFNQFLPSTIGGDVVRSWWTREALGSHLVSLTVVAVDRVTGLVGFCVVGGLAALLHPAVVRDTPGFWWVVGVGLGIAAAGALTVHSPLRPLWSRLFRAPGFRAARERAQRIHAALLSFREAPASVVAAILLSMVLQGVMIIQYVVLSSAMAIDVPVSGMAVVIPIATLVALLPVTINGIGLREGALAAFGAAIGLGTGDAIALAWAFLFFQLVWAVIGGVLYLVLGRPQSSGALPMEVERVPVSTT